MRENLRKFKNRVEEEGVANATRAASKYVVGEFGKNLVRPAIRPVYEPPSIYLHSKFSHKLNVFNEDWDLLIVLDTARPDALRSLKYEYDFINQVDSKWSVGASSPEWIMNTFDCKFKPDIQETSYISSNPYFDPVLSKRFEIGHRGEPERALYQLKKFGITKPVHPSEFHSSYSLYDIGQDYGVSKYPSPRAVTDQTIRVGRQQNPSKIIAHYMPPHAPYFVKASDDEMTILEERRPVTYEAYLDNLRWALSEVQILLNNIDRDSVVITADHGENFFLRPLRDDHNVGMIDPTVRRVPWARTSAKDQNNHTPRQTSKPRDTDVTESLSALGYI